MDTLSQCLISSGYLFEISFRASSTLRKHSWLISFSASKITLGIDCFFFFQEQSLCKLMRIFKMRLKSQHCITSFDLHTWIIDTPSNILKFAPLSLYFTRRFTCIVSTWLVSRRIISAIDLLRDISLHLWPYNYKLIYDITFTTLLSRFP